MINLSIAAAVLALVFGVFTLWLGALAAFLPALVAGLGTYFVLARRTLKQLNALLEKAGKQLNPPPKTPQQVDAALGRAIEITRQGYALSRRQLLIEGQLDAHIGILYYVRQDFPQAASHFEKVSNSGRVAQMLLLQNWTAWTMYAACLFRSKKYERMESVLEKVAQANKKQPFVWGVYAYLMEQSLQHDKAVAKLAEGLTHNPGHEAIQSNLTDLRNNKRMKMARFGEQWYQYFLEPVPQHLLRPQVRFR